MTESPKPSPPASHVSDSLASFTHGLIGGQWRDGPLSGYVKDVNGGYASVYMISWIARAAIDAIPEDCFKRGYQWVAEAEQITLLERLEKRHRIQKKKQKAMSLSRLDGEAYIYMDVARGSVGQELRVDSVGRDQLRFVNVLRMSDVTKGEIETDPLSEYFGQPKYYEVRSNSVGSVRIHPSRIIRFVNAPDPESGEGTSALNYLLQPILAAETARDNTVALTTEARVWVMKAALNDAMGDPVTEAKLVRRFQLFKSMLETNRMAVIDKECEDFDQRTTEYNTLPEVIETMRREVSAAIGIPYSLLFGRPGGLGTNGETEIQTYYDNIATMQRNDIQPVCEPLDEVVIRSALGNRPPEIYIDWLSLWEMSDKEKAEVAKLQADAAKLAIDAGVIPADVLTAALVNSWVEIGAFQGIEQEYSDWVAGGGVLEEPGDESDVSGRDVAQASSRAVADAAPRTLYVSRKVQNANEIIGWARSQGFKETLRPEDLHVTIAYSRDPVDWMKVGEAWQSKIEIAEGGPRLTEIFGEAKVLLFKSSDLEWRHQSIREAGASWDHPEYQPHITISYGDMPENVEPYQGKIILGPEIFEEVNDNWREENA